MLNRRQRLAAASALAMLLSTPALAQGLATHPAVAPIGATAPTVEGGANAAALLYNRQEPARSIIAATG